MGSVRDPLAPLAAYDRGTDEWERVLRVPRLPPLLRMAYGIECHKLS